MKKFAILILVVFGQLYFSQSKVRKYNSLKDQYEYFNSDGDMVGYQKYNSLQKQWEYYEIDQKKYESRYDDMEYIKPDLSNIASTLSMLQKNNDINNKYVQKQIDFLTSKVYDLNLPSEDKKTIIDRFIAEPLKYVNNLQIDYSSSDSTNKVVDYLSASMNKIIEEVSRQNTMSTHYLAKFFNRELNVYKIEYYDTNNEYVKDEKIKTNSYIKFMEKEIVFKKASGEILSRIPSNSKFIADKNYYIYDSNYGRIIVDKNVNYVKFYGNSGTNYIYYISK